MNEKLVKVQTFLAKKLCIIKNKNN